VINMKKYFLLLLLLILVSGCSETVDKAEEISEEEVELEVDQEEAVKTEEKVLGESFVAGDFTWKITGVETATKVGSGNDDWFIGEEADGIFLIISVEVENTGKKSAYLSDSYLTLVDDQDREFSADSMAAIYLDDDSALSFEEINPGIKKKGKIVFDVPPELSIANIRIQSSLFETEFYNVKIDIPEN